MNEADRAVLRLIANRLDTANMLLLAIALILLWGNCNR